MDSYNFHLQTQSELCGLPRAHVDYLSHLKSNGYNPGVIYDIGSSILHWTHEAEKLWPDATIVLFDAFDPAEFLYQKYLYHMGVLSNVDNNHVKFYLNPLSPGGGSYYREIGFGGTVYFPADQYTKKSTLTLDTVVKTKKFPLPDLIKIDVQGCEKDVIEGAQMCLQHANHLIVEMQHINYNENAPHVNITLPYIESLGWECHNPLFCNNGPDGDYGFIKKHIL
jgi:FkbM family methyltransferase